METTGKLTQDSEKNGAQIRNSLKQIYTEEFSDFFRGELYFLRTLKILVKIPCFEEATRNISVAFNVATKIIVSPQDIKYTDLGRLESKLFLISDAIRNRTRQRNMTTTELNVIRFTKKEMDSTSLPYAQQCRYISEDARLSIYSPVIVLANILKCKHVQFGQSEYEIDSIGEVIIFSPALKLLPGEYMVRTFNTIRFLPGRLPGRKQTVSSKMENNRTG